MSRYRRYFCKVSLTTLPKTSNRHISGTIRDIATELQTDVPCVKKYLPADFGVVDINGLFWQNFYGFRDFLNANNSQTAEAITVQISAVPRITT
jgi:hypothetical protein